jgi:hypothetical protein
MYEVAILPVLAVSCIGTKAACLGLVQARIVAIEDLTTKKEKHPFFVENSSEFSPRPGNCDLQRGNSLLLLHHL